VLVKCVFVSCIGLAAMESLRCCEYKHVVWFIDSVVLRVSASDGDVTDQEHVNFLNSIFLHRAP
jgi:hypothetical protein